MHRSRLVAFVLDTKTDDLDTAAKFWSQALNKPVGKKDDDGKYIELETANDEPILLLQQVDHHSHIHLDIETDDVEAEVARLEKLGAKRLTNPHGRWWVMEAPTGHRFCVVRRQRKEFGPHLNEWK